MSISSLGSQTYLGTWKNQDCNIDAKEVKGKMYVDEELFIADLE